MLSATAAWFALHGNASSAGLLTRAMYLNLALGIFNLIPFLPTDGYFIASTLMRQTNIRERAWPSLRSFFAGGSKPPLALWVYLLGFAGAVVFLLGGRLFRIVSGFSEHPLSSGLRLAFTVGLIGILVVRRIRAKKASSAADRISTQEHHR